MNSFNEIEKLWLEFYAIPFPSELVGEDVKGIAIISLDTFTAGCISTFVSSKGRLDRKSKSILEASEKELESVVNFLNGESKSYFERLLNLVKEILQFLKCN